MKKTILSLLCMCALVAPMQAQKTPKVLVVDVATVLNGYYKAQEAQQQLTASEQEAQTELRKMVDRAVTISNELNELQAKANNPALTEEARKKYGEQIKVNVESIRKKETEINTFRQNTAQTLTERRQRLLEQQLKDIQAVTREIATQMGADLVFNTNGLIVVYYDEAYEITDKVLKAVNADAPSPTAKDSNK